MAGSSPLSFRVDEEVITALDDAVADERNVSRSEFARVALLRGLEALTDEQGDVDVPDWLGHDAKVRQMIASNKATRRQGKFRSEFSKQLKSSFQNNETPAEFRDSVAGYLEEANDMGELPEGVREHADTDATTYAEWCEEMLEYYRVAYQSQNWDHDPIDNPLGNHEGIEDARQWMKRAEAIATAGSDLGPESRREKRRKLSRQALEDGVVPEHVKEKATEADGVDLAAAVAAAAVESAESRAITDAENPELDR